MQGSVLSRKWSVVHSILKQDYTLLLSKEATFYYLHLMSESMGWKKLWGHTQTMLGADVRCVRWPTSMSPCLSTFSITILAAGELGRTLYGLSVDYALFSSVFLTYFSLFLLCPHVVWALVSIPYIWVTNALVLYMYADVQVGRKWYHHYTWVNASHAGAMFFPYKLTVYVERQYNVRSTIRYNKEKIKVQ